MNRPNKPFCKFCFSDDCDKCERLKAYNMGREDEISLYKLPEQLTIGKGYELGYKKGRKETLDKVRDWCSDALASNEPTAEQKQGIAMCLSWVIAEQLKED